VSRALHLPLWGTGSAPLDDDEQLVVVLSRVSQVRKVLEALRHGIEKPPILVVAWGLPERQIVSLLTAGIATVDGSVVTDPSGAAAALDGHWDEHRFEAERELAEALAEMESHLMTEEEPCP
jgi:hypothetical protein